MAWRWCGGSFAIALVLGCTGANPAFDRHTGSRGGTDDDDGDGSSSGRPDTGDEVSTAEVSSGTATEDSGIVDTSDGTDTDTDPTGGTCSQAAPVMVGQAMSIDATECPSSGFIRGHVLELAPSSFAITDCGECGGTCSVNAPSWTITLDAPIVPEGLRAGDCLDVFYDCDDAELTTLHNLVLMEGSSRPLLVVAAPALPEALGGWEPDIEDGAACPSNECPENAEMRLLFLDEDLGEHDNGPAHLRVAEDEVELDVSVVNAHYDPGSCEPIVVWVGKG